MSYEMLRFDIEKACDDCRGLLPIPGLGPQLLAAGFGKAIEACPAVVFRCAPLRRNRAFMLQLEQQGIERALIHSQKVAADLLDAPSDTVAVLRPKDVQCLEDHQRKRSLQYVRFSFMANQPLGF